MSPSEVSKAQHVIIVPGLGDSTGFFKWATSSWEKLGIRANIHKAPWNDTSESYEEKLQRLIKLIDSPNTTNADISLIGISDGGSLVLNAYAKRKDKIKRVANVCGRLIPGENVGRPLASFSRRSKAFVDSVEKSRKNLGLLNQTDRKKFMTMSAIYDELVPYSTSIMQGAKNVRVQMISHMLSIVFSFTVMRVKIIGHILSR